MNEIKIVETSGHADEYNCFNYGDSLVFKLNAKPTAGQEYIIGGDVRLVLRCVSNIETTKEGGKTLYVCLFMYLCRSVAITFKYINALGALKEESITHKVMRLIISICKKIQEVKEADKKHLVLHAFDLIEILPATSLQQADLKQFLVSDMDKLIRLIRLISLKMD